MERNIDIVEIMLKLLPNESETHKRIRFYLQTHKSLCNDYLFNSNKYKERAIILSDIYIAIASDLCMEISNKIYS